MISPEVIDKDSERAFQEFRLTLTNYPKGARLDLERLFFKAGYAVGRADGGRYVVEQGFGT